MRIICILGRSGTGKSTVEKKLSQLGYNRIISYTSRQPRGNEENGREYHFVSRNEFEGLIKKNILMEYTEYNGNYYGAPKPVGSINSVIVVERQGFQKIKEIYGKQAIGVFIDITDEELMNRIKHRGDTDTVEQQNRRIEDARIFDGIEDEVDLVVNGNQEPDLILMNILNYIKGREKCK